MNTQIENNTGTLSLDTNYRDFLYGIKGRLKAAQIRAALAANCATSCGAIALGAYFPANS